MANVSVYNMEGKEVGSIELNDAVFGVEVNEHLVHMAVVNQLANNRQGTQSAKTRSEVSGGGRKPWRQKGTGDLEILIQTHLELFLSFQQKSRRTLCRQRRRDRTDYRVSFRDLPGLNTMLREAAMVMGSRVRGLMP